MQNKILDGRVLSQQIKDKIKQDISKIKGDRKPCLAVVLVGNDKASGVYVKSKKKACEEVGILSKSYELVESTTEDELLFLINKLNVDNTVDGILVQLPLPKHINTSRIINAINADKDVDGFHLYNMGALATNNAGVYPCTPHGIMYMLDAINVEYSGLYAVVVGSSNIVGRPMALELLNRGATVTICNSKTKNITNITRNADLLIVGVGQANLIKDDWVKDGAIVVDVGINRLLDGGLCGDVDYKSVYSKVKFITPVPGGVGPMTIAMLLQNTLECFS